MNLRITSLSVLALGLTCAAYPQTATQPPKVGVIHIQNAIISTKDGQKAAQDLQKRFEPRKQELEKKQADISQGQDQLRKGSNTMSEDMKQKLMRDIDQKTKALNRDTEDAQAELDQEQGKVMQELGQRMMAVIDKYARDNGYSIILDVSSPQTPVLYAANSVDVTKDIIELYDKNAPTAAGSPAASTPAPAAPPAATKPLVPSPIRPAVPTVKKK